MILYPIKVHSSVYVGTDLISEEYLLAVNGQITDRMIFRNGQLCASDSIWEELNKSYGSGSDDTQLPLGNLLDPVPQNDSLEQRRKEGRCEICGKLLEFKRLAMLCPDHGPDYKIKTK